MDREARLAGFANNSPRRYNSANQAYKGYMNANGDDKPDFKEWLEMAKKSGYLDKLLSEAGKKAAADKTPAVPEPLPPVADEPKKFKISKKQIMWIVGSTLVVSAGIFLYYKYGRKSAAPVNMPPTLPAPPAPAPAPPVV